MRKFNNSCNAYNKDAQQNGSGIQQNKEPEGQQKYNRYKLGPSRGNFRGRRQWGTPGRGGGIRSFVAEGEEAEKIVFVCEDGEDINGGINKGNIERCIDSGCSDHLINSKEYFKEYIELENRKKISAAKNGSTLEAVGVGTVEVRRLENKVFTDCIFCS